VLPATPFIIRQLPVRPERHHGVDRQRKIIFGEKGVRGLLVYCADYRCSHSIAISGDRWPDDLRYPTLRIVSPVRPAAIGPDFNWKRQPVATMGYR